MFFNLFTILTMTYLACMFYSFSGLLSCVEESPISSFLKKKSGNWVSSSGKNSWRWLGSQLPVKVNFFLSFNSFISFPRLLFYLNFNSCSIQNVLEQKRRHSPGPHEPSLRRGDCDSKQGVSDFSVSGDAEQETAFSGNTWFKNKAWGGNLQL